MTRHENGLHADADAILAALAQALWVDPPDVMERWVTGAVTDARLAQVDVARARIAAASPPKGTSDVVGRLRRIALALLAAREYRLQAVFWQAASDRGMNPQNARQRIFDAQVAGGDWAGAVATGGLLLSLPAPRPQWRTGTRAAVRAMLGGGAAQPSRKAVAHVLQHTGLRFLDDVLAPQNDAGDTDLTGVEADFLAGRPDTALQVRFVIALGNRGHHAGARAIADALIAAGTDTPEARLAKAACAVAAGGPEAARAALSGVADLPVAGDLLPLAAVLAAACGSPDLRILAHRIAASPAAATGIAALVHELRMGAPVIRDLTAALVAAGADPLGFLDAHLAAGTVLDDTAMAEAITLVEADTTDRRPDRTAALGLALLERTGLGVATAASFCRRNAATLCATQPGAALLARVLGMVQDWDAALRAWDAVLVHTPAAPSALSRAYLAAARAGRADLAQTYLAQVALDDPTTEPVLLTLAHGACILGDFALGRTMLDRSAPGARGPDAHNLAGRLRAVLAGDGSALGRDGAAPAVVPDGAPPPQVLVIDPGYGNNASHHFGYAQFAIDHYPREMGIPAAAVRVCVRRAQAGQNTADDAALRPSLHQIFDFNPYAFDEFPKTRESLQNLNLAWQADLTQALDATDLSGVRVVHCHSLRPNMAVGFARWVADRFRGRPVCVIAGVIEVDYLTEGESARAACADSYAQAAAILRGCPDVRLVFCAETALACAHLGDAVGPATPVHCIPYLAAAMAGPADAVPIPFAGDTVTIGLLGGSRHERGIDLFPELILALADRDDVRWIVQLDRATVEAIDPVFPLYLDWAVTRGICEWHDGRLERSDYHAALRRMDVVLMPYRDRYAVSGSGVFYEAVQLERYLVVPGATFMRDLLAGWDYPSAILPGISVPAVLRALREVLQDRTNLHGAMRRLRAQGGSRLPLGTFRALLRAALPPAPPRGPTA